MFFFKLMFLKKKKKLDNKGAALANVLLITTFVMVITSSVLSMAYNTYRMKLINVSSKDNLYACEAVLEQVRVGFRNQFTEITDSYTELTADNVVKAFETFYKDYQLDDCMVGDGFLVGNSISGTGIYYYDIVKVAELLTSISGTGNATVIVDETNATTNLGYNEGTPVFTSSVDITVNNTDYENIKVTLQANATGKNNFELTETYVTFHDLTVIYSENGYESEVTTDITIEFPEVGTVTVSTGGNQGGLVTLMDNRLKTYGEWVDAFDSDPDYADFNFYPLTTPSADSNPGSASYDMYYINTTDYPANTVSYIIFDLDRYYIYQDGDNYTYLSEFPIVYSQMGEGVGQQYPACGDGNYDNVEIYIGGDEEDDSSWVPYSEVFSNYFIDSDYLSDPTSAAYKYYLYYGDSLTSELMTDSYDSTLNPTIRYRVHLIYNKEVRSRGWIGVTGGVHGDSKGVAIQPITENGVKIYVDITEASTVPKYYFNSSSSQTGNYFDYIFFDCSNSNYFVGDVLHVTLKGVDPDMVFETGHAFTIGEQTVDIYGTAGANIAYITANTDTTTSEYDISTGITTTYVTGDSYYVVYQSDKTYMDIYITMKWDTYPYLTIFYWADSSNTSVTLTTEWISGSGTTTTTTTGTTSDAVIYYEDWRKE